jgi:hypothetical protein
VLGPLPGATLPTLLTSSMAVTATTPARESVTRLERNSVGIVDSGATAASLCTVVLRALEILKVTLVQTGQRMLVGTSVLSRLLTARSNPADPSHTITLIRLQRWNEVLEALSILLNWDSSSIQTFPIRDITVISFSLSISD